MSNSFSIPDDIRVYAIGDIHGMNTKLDYLHEEIAIDLVKNPVQQPVIVYLGDYVDRGEDSAKTLENLIHRKNLGDQIQRHFLMGNHEDVMIQYMKSPHGVMDWLEFGGDKTMADYGVDVDLEKVTAGYAEAKAAELKGAVPAHHHEFLDELELFVEIGDYFFAHAGIRPGVALDQQDKHDLTFIREPFLSSTTLHPKRIVHGHTPVKEVDMRPNRINVDTGAAYGTLLSCVVLEGTDARVISVAD